MIDSVGFVSDCTDRQFRILVMLVVDIDKVCWWFSCHPVSTDYKATVVPVAQALPGNQKVLFPSSLPRGRSAAHRIGWLHLLR